MNQTKRARKPHQVSADPADVFHRKGVRHERYPSARGSSSVPYTSHDGATKVSGRERSDHAQDETFDRIILVAALSILGGGMSFLLVMAFLLFPEWISPLTLAPGVRTTAASGRIVVLRPPTRLLEEGIPTASVPAPPTPVVAPSTPVVAADTQNDSTGVPIGNAPDGGVLEDQEPTSEVSAEIVPACGEPSCTPPASTGPTGNAPVGNAPPGNAPVGNAPSGNSPAGKAVGGHGPAGHDPAGHGPKGNAPRAEVPSAGNATGKA